MANVASLSSRRAWIEIRPRPCGVGRARSLSSRRAWIEIWGVTYSPVPNASLSSRRAWIEIGRRHRAPTWTAVALLTESVD